MVEVKSSVRDSFPNPDKLNLTQRGNNWVDQVALGDLNGQKVTPEAQAYAIEVKELIKSGYTLKPILAKVSVPPPGTTGVTSINMVPAG